MFHDIIVMMSTLIVKHYSVIQYYWVISCYMTHLIVLLFGCVARDGCQALKEYVAMTKKELPEPDSSQWMSRMVSMSCI